MGMMLPPGGMGGSMKSGGGGGGGMLPSMSDLSSYNPYDSSAGSLLMGGNLEDSPLFLAPGTSSLGGGGSGDGGILPPLPKKRKEHPPVSISDMQFPPNPSKHI